MTLVRFNQKPAERKVNTVFEDLFNGFPSRFFNEEFNTPNSSVPVNIKENDSAYLLEVVAPGMEKTDFKVNVDNNLLTVSAEKKANPKNENERQVRREFSVKSFARTFTLDETIDAEKIQGKYENGVLHLELPKKEQAKVQPKEINIL